MGVTFLYRNFDRCRRARLKRVAIFQIGRVQADMGSGDDIEAG
jgi:hypothetical protein